MASHYSVCFFVLVIPFEFVSFSVVFARFTSFYHLSVTVRVLYTFSVGLTQSSRAHPMTVQCTGGTHRASRVCVCVSVPSFCLVCRVWCCPPMPGDSAVAVAAVAKMAKATAKDVDDGA